MKKIVVENETGGSLIIKWSLDDVQVGAGEKIKIEVPLGETLRVFKNYEKSSQICRAEHYHEEDVARKWSFAPVVLINTDAFVDAKSLWRIEITEEVFLYSRDVVFSVLAFNGKAADSYDFHDEQDAKKYKLYTLIYLIPFGIFCVALGLFVLGIIITGLFLEELWISLLFAAGFIVSILILRSMVKTVRKFLNLSSKAKEIISESQKVLLYQHSSNFIKFADSEVENGSHLYE